MDECLRIATTIAGLGRVSIAAAKQAINMGYEMPLSAGLKYEREWFTVLRNTVECLYG